MNKLNIYSNEPNADKIVLKGSLAEEPCNEITPRILSHYRDDSRISQLIPGFLASLKEQVADLEDVLVSEDFVSTKSMVHELKGACGSYGFPSLYDSLAQLEKTLASKGLTGKAMLTQFLKFKEMVERAEA